MHWIGGNFDFCRSLESTDKSLNLFESVNGLHLDKFLGFRLSNTCKVIFFGILVLSRVPQQASLRILLTICEFH